MSSELHCLVCTFNHEVDILLSSCFLNLLKWNYVWNFIIIFLCFFPEILQGIASLMSQRGRPTTPGIYVIDSFSAEIFT